MSTGETCYRKGRNHRRFHCCETQAVHGSKPEDNHYGVSGKETPEAQQPIRIPASLQSATSENQGSEIGGNSDFEVALSSSAIQG